MPKLWKNVRAQTAMELAVFGAILIFVVGAIVRQALSAGSMQNEYLRATRQAMSTSYRYSSGLMGIGGANGTASHQTATILFVEDRLTADSAKYGAIERTPYMVSAAASYSRNLFLPVDAGENHNLPIFDMFINGKHFPFRVAQFKRVDLARNCAGASPCPAECAGGCPADSMQFYPGPDLPCANKIPCPLQCGGDCSALPASSWEPDCMTAVKTLSQCVPGDCIAACSDFGNNCTISSGPPVTDTQTVGCAKLYTVIYNHGSYLEWCTDEPGDPACPVAGDPVNLTADERFDLDRSGGPLTTPPDVPAGGIPPPRKDFSWQWYLVSGYDAAVDRPDVTLKYPESGIILEASDCASACKPSRYTAADVDGDLKLEQIMVDTKDVDWIDYTTIIDASGSSSIGPGVGTGVIRGFTVMDSQDGDLDFSRGDSDTGPQPGLIKDMKMFTRVQGGTFLQIEEGKLYATSDDANQYIRTTQQKDQIDLVERTIQLSNDTDRFCDRNGNVTALGSPDWAQAGWNPPSLPNPVEACNSCFSGANIQKTCMDEANKLIYVRSRVVDRHGHKWITNTSGDDYVDFTRPMGP